MNYGIRNVVGGFGQELSQDEEMVATLSRTYVELAQLRKIIPRYNDRNKTAIELGCGYGRLIPVLTEYFDVVYGYERDQELIKLARKFNPKISFFRFDHFLSIEHIYFLADFIFTFTVLQHVPNNEIKLVIDAIQKMIKNDGIILICEETNRERSAAEVTGRTIEEYQQLFDKMNLICTTERWLEESNPYRIGGHYMLFGNKK